MNTLEFIKKNRIVMIYRGIEPEECLEVTKVLNEAGIKLFEVTLNTPSALKSISLLKEKMGNEIMVGAGTVTKVEQVKQVADAGGTYIISPNMDVSVIKRTKELGLFSVSGAFSPSEIYNAYEAGSDLIKVFPINVVGPEYINQVKGPFDQIPLMAVGGVQLDMVEGLIKAGSDAIGIGIPSIGKNLIASKDYKGLKEKAEKFVKAAGL